MVGTLPIYTRPTWLRFLCSALGLLANLKKTREVKGASQVEATSIMPVVKE